MKNYPLYDVAYYSRVSDMLAGWEKQYGGQPAVSWFTRKQEEQGVTFAELHEDVKALKEVLIRKGLAGKHIAVAGENSYEWLLVFLAAAYCGSVTICIDIEQSEETILQMLAMADTDAIFLSGSYLDICKKYAGEEKPLFFLNAKDSDTDSVPALVQEGKKLLETEGEEGTICSRVRKEQPLVIVFTSGTTSYSKPVVLTQEAVLTNASDAIANVEIGPRTFTSLPFYHTYGLTCSVLAMLMSGTHLYINGSLKTVMRDMRLAKPHTLLAVPLMLENIHNKIWLAAEQEEKAEKLRSLLKFRKFLFSMGYRKSGRALAAVREKSLGQIRQIICGGAHMSMEIMEDFACMGVNVLQGYGITECAPLVSVNRNGYNKLGTVGQVSAHCEVKIEDGEILVRGTNVMLGYYHAPELTSEAMKDGWFCTGDLGELDKDGFLSITGRKKNLIVFKNGKKVSPEKLEEKLKKIPLVQDVVVYGAMSGISTDDVQLAASIYPDRERAEGMTSYEILENLQAEIDKMNRELPIYQQIQLVNIREQEFSKTAIQKIKRHMI